MKNTNAMVAQHVAVVSRLLLIGKDMLAAFCSERISCIVPL